MTALQVLALGGIPRRDASIGHPLRVGVPRRDFTQPASLGPVPPTVIAGPRRQSARHAPHGLPVSVGLRGFPSCSTSTGCAPRIDERDHHLIDADFRLRRLGCRELDGGGRRCRSLRRRTASRQIRAPAPSMPNLRTVVVILVSLRLTMASTVSTERHGLSSGAR